MLERYHDFESPLINVLVNMRDMISTNDGWLALLARYTGTKLTKDSDRLVALAGVAKVACTSMGLREEDYAAGLWNNDLAVDLLWRVGDTEGFRIQHCCVAPSWSWASIDGHFQFNSGEIREDIRKCLKVQIIGVDLETEGGYLGPVKRGTITMRGVLRSVHISDEPLGDTSSLQSGVRIAFDEPSDLREGEDFVAVFDDEKSCLPVGPDGIHAYWIRFTMSTTTHVSEGLLLQQATGAAPGYFQRIGWMKLFDDHDTWFQSPIVRFKNEGLNCQDDQEYTFNLV